MKLTQALALLDPAVEEHWTSDGLPRMDALVDLTGDSSITRKAVTNAAPSLTRRTAAELEGEPEEPAEAPEEPAEPPAEAPPEEPAAPAEPESEPEAPAEEPVDPSSPPPPDPTAPCEPGQRGPLVMEQAALDMPVRDVLSDAQLTAQAIREIEEKVKHALQAKKAIEVELAQLYQKNEILKRQAIIHERAAPKKSTGVQAYLAAQQETRRKRAERAQAFIAAGTTQADVADAMRPGSQLDAAMNRRKAGRGTVRPPARLMTTGA